jgi:hypothetical protein
VEWIDALQGEVIGLDTAPIIYFIEEHPSYLEAMRYFFGAMERWNSRAITSTITLLEVLVQPFRQNNFAMAVEYRNILLNAANLWTISILFLEDFGNFPIANMWDDANRGRT